MGHASKEALLEYTKKSKSDTKFLQGIGVVALVGGLASFGVEELGVLFPLFFIAGGIFMFYMGGKNDSEYKKYLKIADSTGELQRVLNDFANAQSLADDRIRLGSEYIFGKNQGRPVSYAELRKVYPHIYKGSRCARQIDGVTVSGQTRILCDFIIRNSQKDPHPDESYIYQVIVSRNPNVYIGYK